MSQPYVGQLMLTGFNFPPVGWHNCDGSLLPISEYDTLFNLLGTTFGGDGQQTFGIPDLRGRVPVGMGQGQGLGNYVLGQMAGSESVTLIATQTPSHSHNLMANSSNGSNPFASGNTPAVASSAVYHQGAPSTTAMSAQMINAVGGNQPHDNMQPYLTVNWAISLYGIYPSQS